MSDPALPASFVAVLQLLTDWLKAEQVPHTIIGGVAVSLLAQPRATQDIDAVIWLDQNRWAAFLHSGKAYGFEARISQLLEFAQQARVLLLRHQASGLSVDLSCGALVFEEEMIARAKTLKLEKLAVKVPTLEDLIITKAVAQRPKDIADIESLLKVQANLDFERIRFWTQAFAEALDMPELMTNLEKLLKPSKPKGFPS